MKRNINEYNLAYPQGFDPKSESISKQTIKAKNKFIFRNDEQINSV